MDHIYSAISSTVHDSSKPAKALAVEIGIGHQVLLNKANEACEHNKLNVHEAVALMKASGSTRILEAMAMEVGGVQVLATGAEESGCLMMATIKAASEHGDVVRAVETAMADKRLTAREREKCHHEIDEAISALMTLRKAVTDYQ
ncbi:hypothetical protein GCM10011348_46170 [Marinobacterium nitratireducens]|uniref:Uncharacterized protein n=1 Tax=Marinobacterium nitratireducens TaxID=518897 RepID=A0A917ZQZ6_9GAMM|nr:phage regulatory CII family protein [Marinobacterium nitratireducens]GGO89133.1 hypothetical protein GCM10011348_46170 [Marinobacterium nitratireducens]